MNELATKMDQLTDLLIQVEDMQSLAAIQEELSLKLKNAVVDYKRDDPESTSMLVASASVDGIRVGVLGKAIQNALSLLRNNLLETIEDTQVDADMAAGDDDEE